MMKRFQFEKVKYKVDTQKLQGEDLVVGQIVFFRRQLYSGGRRRFSVIGYENYIAEIAKESYGSTGQHTFTLKVLRSFDKKNERFKGDTIRVKGRHLYPNCEVLVNPDDVESKRSEKHERGNAAKRDYTYTYTFDFDYYDDCDSY